MKSHTKEDTSQAVAKLLGISPSVTDAVLQALLNNIMQVAVDGKSVQYRNFGTFKVSTTKSRKGRNPATGAAMEIPSKQAVKFVPSKRFLESLNGGDTSHLTDEGQLLDLTKAQAKKS